MLSFWLFRTAATRGHVPFIYLLLAGVLIANFLAFAGFQSAGYTWLNHDPTTAITGWYWVTAGAPIYHEVDAAPRYSVLYGPLVAIVYALFMKVVGPGMITAKLCGIIGTVAAVAVVAATLWRAAGARVAAVGVAYVLLVIGPFRELPFSKGEPYMLLATAAGVWAVVVPRRPLPTAILLALALGLAINIKAHAGLYFVPAAMLMYRRFGFAWTAASLLAAAPVVAAPFVLMENISLRNYLAWLRVAGRHGLAMSEFTRTCIAAAVICTPPIAAAVAVRMAAGGAGSFDDDMPRGSLDRFIRRHGLLIGCTSCVGLTIIAASKPGAGSHHLVPFAPLFAYVIADALRRLRERRDAAPAALEGGRRASLVLCDLALLGFIALTAVLTITREIPAVEELRRREPASRRILAELDDIMRRHADRRIAIGYGTPDPEAVFRFRQYLVYRGHPYLLDYNAYMDMKLAGVPLPPATLRAIAQCDIDVWLMPRDAAPFDWWDVYATDGSRLFPPELAEAFLRHYEVRDRTPHFDLWFCKGSRDSAKTGY